MRDASEPSQLNQPSEPNAEGPRPGMPAPVQSQPPGCLSALAWFAAGWVLPCFSLTFYSHAIRRRTGWAVGFFLIFMLTITGLQTLGLIWGLIQAGQAIQQTFKSGDFPEITISGGEAVVSGPQPFILIAGVDCAAAADRLRAGGSLQLAGLVCHLAAHLSNAGRAPGCQPVAPGYEEDGACYNRMNRSE